MSSGQGWIVRPIFITSTFRDLHAERNLLRDYVFPELEERLRGRRCHLEPIDLRLGVETVEVASEEDKELRVLREAAQHGMTLWLVATLFTAASGCSGASSSPIFCYQPDAPFGRRHPKSGFPW